MSQDLKERIKTTFDSGSGKPASTTKARNPYLEIVRQNSRLSDFEARKAAAKLGFLVVIIYSDGVVADQEIRVLKDISARYLRLKKDEIDRVVKSLLDVDREHLEFHFLAKELGSRTEPEERKVFLSDLFKMANADDEYAKLEDEDIRMISKYLFLSDFEFEEEKEKSEEQF